LSRERLQKILSRAGVASRRKAEDLIREGRVTVNGETAGIGDQADLESDAIKVDGKLLRPSAERRYWLLNKPRGYITTRRDPEGRPTVIELLPPKERAGLFPVGRLDFDSEGLLILTDDGELAQRISHPRFGCRKTYEVKVKGVPERAALDRLSAGIRIDGKLTAPARVRPMRSPGGRAAESTSWWRVELAEGRTLQIRRMFLRLGHPVRRLRRVAIGRLKDPRLPTGAARRLRPEEVASLRRATGGRAKRGGPPRRGGKP
jgi:23S rRNA pseudouridine2605 synthase